MLPGQPDSRSNKEGCRAAERQEAVPPVPHGAVVPQRQGPLTVPAGLVAGAPWKQRPDRRTSRQGCRSQGVLIMVTPQVERSPTGDLLLTFEAVIWSRDGSRRVSARVTGAASQAQELGIRAAEQLRSQGGDDLLK